MKNVYSLFCVALLLGACKDKKMIVMSKGPAEVNTDAKTIKTTDGTGHEEKEFVLNGGNVTYKINSPAGEASVELQGDGLFIVNAKQDTIVGGIQVYGDPNQKKIITQEDLKHRIDSMTSLSEGKNANATHGSYFILPNQAVRISGNTQATVVGPYHNMRSVEKVDGKDPEVYKFYSIREFRDKIEELRALTVSEKK